MRRFFAFVFVIASAAAARASLVETQTFTLQPGWNAIFLDVEPANPDPAAVFGSIPADSVWTWNGRQAGIDFVKDSTEVTIQRPGWLGFFPATTQYAFLSNLHAVRGNRAYLVKLGGSAPASLQVTGKPTVQPFGWVADSFNLVGFKADPAAPPTFTAFLSPSPAHIGQPVYTMTPAGTWRLVSASAETIQPGRAYWVYTRGASNYTGPIAISLPQAQFLEFGNTVSELDMGIINTTGSDSPVTATLLTSTAPVKLLYWQLAADGTQLWPVFPNPLSKTVKQRSEVVLRLGLDRASFASDRVESILEIKSSGQRWAIPIGASRNGAANAFGSGRLRALATGDRFAGLWIGIVSVNKVSLSQNAGATPLATNKSFDFRMLIHVSDSSSVNLLKEVIQMWQNGTLNPDKTVNTPGHFVLLSDDALVPTFQGASLRDGVPVGRRVSTAGYDFDGDKVAMTGSFGPPNTLTWTLSMPINFPTNPFRHKFHPDHDNLDALYVNTVAEAYPVTRNMSLIFSATDPSGATPPGWGDSVVGGTYRETIAGLHKNPIYVEGTFRLTRVALIGVLNQ